jgi:RES domain-containing protein
MRVWRISNYIDLSGRGGLIASGRWHRVGMPVVYTADHPATAMLETLAHLNVERVPPRYRLLAIELPDDGPVHRVSVAELPRDWETDMERTQSLGATLLARAAHLSVLVPSVLVPHAWNVLLNPLHPDMARCSVAEVIERAFDTRLIR